MQQITKRIKNSLIQGFIAHLFLLCIFGVIFYLMIIPRLESISLGKEELVSMHAKLENISKQGIPYGEFKKNISQNGDEYFQALLQEMTVDFYNENFVNSEEEDYDTFLLKLQEEVRSVKESPDYIRSQEQQKALLPFYSDDEVFSEEGLSDFDFVNYVENLLYAFNLEYSGDIGIGDIEKIGTDTQSSIQDAVFRIPLVFEVTGQKGDFIDLLHFFENVAVIELIDESITVYEDNVLSQSLEQDISRVDYNVYENQIVDIHMLSLSDYPDSSSSIGNSSDIVERIKGSQSREKISADLELYFYVSGLPGYKIEKFIFDFLDEVELFKKEISQATTKYTSSSIVPTGPSIQAINSLKSLEALILSLDEDLEKIRESVIEKKNIEEIYSLTQEYAKDLDRIQESYESYIQILDTTE